MKLEEIIGSRIKVVRERSNLSQTEFAGKIGLTSSAVTQYEGGTKKPSTEVLLRIAKTFGISVDYLLGSAETPAIFLQGELHDFLQSYSKLQPRDRQLIVKLVEAMQVLC